MSRVYVPGALTEVIAWFDAGAVPAGAPAFGISEASRAEHPDADEEELEYLATVEAHAAVAAGRPAVVALDVADQGGQTLAADVPVSRWAAVFVDDLQWYSVAEIEHLR